MRADLDDATAINVFFYANNEAIQGTARDYVPDAAADPLAAPDQRVIAYNFGSTADPTISAALPAQKITNKVFDSEITVDGDLADWASLTSFGTDPIDVFGSSNPIDWREGWMAHSDDNYYIAWENKLPTQRTWGNGIMLDTDSSNATGFTGFSAELPMGIDYLIETDSLFRYTGSGTDWSWEFVDSVTLSMAGNHAEMRIPSNLIDNTVSIRLFFTGDNSALGGSSIDFYPDSVTNSQLDQQLRTHWYTQSALPANSTQVFTPVTDGVLTEWRDDLQIGDDDPAEPDSINSIDWKQAFAGHNDESVYFAYTMHQPIDLNWGYGMYIDSDTDTSTGFTGFANELPLGADILIEGGTLYFYNGTSQSEWNWTATQFLLSGTAGNTMEMGILREVLGNPDSIDFMFRGDNSAVNGNSIDLLPDSGVFNYVLNRRATAPTPLLDAPTLQAALDDPSGNAPILKEINALNMNDDGGTGGTGSVAQWALAWLGVLFGLRLFIRKQIRILAPLTVLVVLLSGCDSGAVGDSNGASNNGDGNNNGSNTGGSVTDGQNQQGQNQQQPESSVQPSNKPRFDVTAQLGAALPDSQPSNDASLTIGIQADLSGVEVVPAVATNAGGTIRVSYDKSTGALQGQVQHTANNAGNAAIYRAPAGQNGQLIVTLQPVDENNYVFEIPAGTALNATQQAQFEQGLFYVVVHTSDQPYGELRAQLQTDEIAMDYQPTLPDLQAKVFSPRCSSCHVGGGTSLPSSMDLSDEQATYASLVGQASLEVEGTDRVMPGMANDSYVVHKIEGTQRVGSRMPFRGEPLPEEAIAAIRQWIDQGALP